MSYNKSTREYVYLLLLSSHTSNIEWGSRPETVKFLFEKEKRKSGRHLAVSGSKYFYGTGVTEFLGLAVGCLLIKLPISQVLSFIKL